VVPLWRDVAGWLLALELVQVGLLLCEHHLK
jgi:hypothetical protein